MRVPHSEQQLPVGELARDQHAWPVLSTSGPVASPGTKSSTGPAATSLHLRSQHWLPAWTAVLSPEESRPPSGKKNTLCDFNTLSA